MATCTASQPMPRAPAALAQLLDVEMQEIARGGPLVPMGRPRRIEAPEPIQPEPALLAHDGAEREPQLAGNPWGAVALPPPAFDLAARRAAKPGGRVLRTTRAVAE